MYKKTFISISFSPGKIEIAQLNSVKKQVVAKGSVDIPEGTIVNYKVADIPSLSKIVKESFKKFHIREKTAGIIVPEFSTFTKTLQVPKLETKELDEAIRWQMQEFLPEGGSAMTMDWKIIKTSADEYQILAVAIPTTVLSGYVQAVEEAGLMPIAVETPSLSLVRVAGGDELKMVIYANAGEAVFIISQGQRIFGSVVSQTHDQDSLFKLASQISTHYNDTNPTKIMLGGMDIGQGLYNKLSELKIPLEWLKLDVAGINSQEVQELLIPLSLQLKDPAEPADETTINLLPPEWVKTYAERKTKLQIWSLVLIASIVIWSCLLSIVGVNLMLNSKLNSLKSLTSQQNEAPAELVSQVNKVNKTADDITKISQATHSPTKIINTINSNKPAAISLNKYEINLEDGKVVITGVSQDRKSLIDFKNSLEKIEDFGPVMLPVSTFEQDTNIQFGFDFTYLPAQKPIKNSATIKIQ